MKTGMTVLGASMILLALIQVGGWAQQKYQSRKNEELYETWIDDETMNSFHMQKIINFADGWKGFSEISDTGCILCLWGLWTVNYYNA